MEKSYFSGDSMSKLYKMNDQYRIVGFLGRTHGLNGLDDLIKSKKYNPVAIFTHSKKASFEDPERKIRPDYAEYVKICKENKIPLYPIDGKKDLAIIDTILAKLKPDFIVAISWRFLIPKRHLEIPKFGGVNLHRGKFPEYKGDFPTERALEAREKEVYITAHILNEEIDGGEVLSKESHPVNYNESVTFRENVERIKKEITPHFGPLLIKSLDLMVEKYENR